MGKESKIEWCDSTWNPWIGCSKVSPGCNNCYMFAGMRQYGRDPEVIRRTSKPTFNYPLKEKEPKLIFTCSWSDFFHKQADPWREEAWDIILRTPWHTYQILTKRPGLAVEWSKTHEWPDNAWIGTSVESQKYAPRVQVLARIKAKVRFVSCEPLLGPVDLTKWLGLSPWDQDDSDESPTYGRTIDWVITGGESGPNRRPADPQWFRDIRDECLAAGVPYFHKQGNAARPGQDRLLDGREWNEMPMEKVAV